MNDTQKNFLKQVADIQEEAVQVALCKYKDGDNIEDLLYDTTFDALVELMVLIDGYGACKGGYDLICRKNGESIKSNPFIELHDVVVEYLKDERKNV